MGRVRLVKRTVLHRGRVIHLVRDVLVVRGRRMVRDTVLHPGAVVVIPILTGHRVVLVRQYRHAVRRELLELPAGTLEPGERPEACARRELEEETGWRARRMRRLGYFYAAPGFISERMTVFLAQDLTPVPARPEPDEMVRPVILPFRTALAKIRSGGICDAKTIIGLHTAWELLYKKS